MKPNRIKLSTLNGIERGATSRHRPHLVFARDDGAGSQKRPAEPPRVLIVEDDFLVAEQMQIALTEAGFEIAGVATSGDEAIKLAIAQSPTLALMDIRLVGHRDGVDTALELFRDHGIRCIFATAYHDRIRAGAQSLPIRSAGSRSRTPWRRWSRWCAAA